MLFPHHIFIPTSPLISKSKRLAPFSVKYASPMTLKKSAGQNYQPAKTLVQDRKKKQNQTIYKVNNKYN